MFSEIFCKKAHEKLILILICINYCIIAHSYPVICPENLSKFLFFLLHSIIISLIQRQIIAIRISTVAFCRAVKYKYLKLKFSFNQDIMYLLTEWEGQMGKYLARGQGVQTERSEARTSWPRAKYFPIWLDLTQSISILSYDHLLLKILKILF